MQGVWRRCHFLILEAVVYIYIYILHSVSHPSHLLPGSISSDWSSCQCLCLLDGCCKPARSSQKLQGKSGERQIAAFCQCRKLGVATHFYVQHYTLSSPHLGPATAQFIRRGCVLLRAALPEIFRRLSIRRVTQRAGTGGQHLMACKTLNAHGGQRAVCLQQGNVCKLLSNLRKWAGRAAAK